MYKAKVYYDENATPSLVVIPKDTIYNVLATVHSDGNSIDFNHPSISINSHCQVTLMELFDDENNPVMCATDDGANLAVYHDSQCRRHFSCYVEIDF